MFNFPKFIKNIFMQTDSEILEYLKRNFYEARFNFNFINSVRQQNTPDVNFISYHGDSFKNFQILHIDVLTYHRKDYLAILDQFSKLG